MRLLPLLLVATLGCDRGEEPSQPAAAEAKPEGAGDKPVAEASPDAANPKAEAAPKEEGATPTLIEGDAVKLEVDACVKKCLDSRRAEAVAWEEIERGCMGECGVTPSPPAQ